MRTINFILDHEGAIIFALINIEMWIAFIIEKCKRKDMPNYEILPFIFMPIGVIIVLIAYWWGR